ncbi:potassium channel protein [Oceanidesulfovibrio indonesiensis]|uniref:Potassium channel protein n=1 Tax=Oceanidesulfovibrio indonesiensis TaxID=54767 RepID=A0A7M3MES8_9BACT|nr:NAD-binding protein [Oceanidesulfovibrio indonesiensis]TVM17394.1 potassium channel protein [Oceanidesulfovibrio indonesiensis]
MKFIPSQMMYLLQDRRAKRNLRALAKFIAVLIGFVTLYSVLFHVLMEQEGQEHTWVTGVYWTLTVMSTLGFGDITFTSDIGRLFSTVVLLSGIVFLLVMLPFAFIQFFYAPFLEAQRKSRAPRELPEHTTGHLIIIGFEAAALSLATRLRRFSYNYCILVPEVAQALELVDQGFRVVVGDYDDPETYRRLRAPQAAMIVALSDDMKNTHAAYTIREVTSTVPIVANADSEDSVDILQLAGAEHTFQFMRMLGEMLARRIPGTDTKSNIIGSLGNLHIAEAPAKGTPMVGCSIQDSGLREATGMNVVGLWERGQMVPPRLETVIHSNSSLVLAGTREQLEAYDTLVGDSPPVSSPVLILGGGRVGRAAAETLRQRDVNYRIVEKNPKLARDSNNWVVGNASDYDILVSAGIREAPSVFVTTHNDDLNIYLTIYCRRLRPDIQIISRATLDRSISVLHKAGADLVMSYSTMAANTVINLLSPGKLLTLTEGLNIFRVKTHPSLAGKSLVHSRIREDTGCSVIAIDKGDEVEINPDPAVRLKKGHALLVIGDAESERRFMRKYPE